jgi:hypothetical protein
MAKSNSGFAPQATDELPTATIDAVPLGELRIDTIAFSEMEQILPVGIFFEGERLQSFTLHPYKTKYDRLLATLINTHKSKAVKILGQFLPQIVATIGGYPVTDLASKLSLNLSLFFERMCFGDVLTLLLHIRKAAQGTMIAMEADCEACGTKNKDNPAKGGYHTLDGLDVPLVHDLKSKPLFEVILQDGIDIPGETIKRVLMQPMKLHHMAKLSEPQSVTDIEMLYAMVVALPDSATYGNIRGQVFSDELYDELTLTDLGILRKAMEKLQIVPDMSLEMNCVRCGHEWKAAVAWGNLRQFLFVPPESAE